jgi:hypothetical protein
MAPGKDGKSSKEKYLEFIRTMSRMFGDTARMTRGDTDEVMKEGLDAITISRDDALCRILGIKDQDMQLPNNLAKVVYESVKKLFARQYAHATKCGEIINRLFRIQRDKDSGYFQISLSPNLIKGGFPELNNINYDTRELLMKYYTDCETTYLHGVQDIIHAKRAADAAKAQQAQAQQAQEDTRQKVVAPRTNVQPSAPASPGLFPPAGPSTAGPAPATPFQFVPTRPDAGTSTAGPTPTTPFRFTARPTVEQVQAPPRSAMSSRGRTIRQPLRFANEQARRVMGNNEFQRRSNTSKRSRV